MSSQNKRALAEQPIGCLVGIMRNTPRPVGYLWRDAGRHWFAYLPEYLASDDAIPLHPVDLPLEHDIFSSATAGFDGALAVFRDCLPGTGSLIVIDNLKRDAFPQFARDAFDCPIGQLAFASLMGGKEGINGLYFHPGDWPDDTIPDQARAAWGEDCFRLPADLRQRLSEAGVPEWAAMQPSQIRCTHHDDFAVKMKGREGCALIGQTESQRQAHRVESAFLRLARACGIQVANFCLLFTDNATLFWRDARHGVRARLEGSGPEDIAQKAADLVQHYNVDLVEVFRRLCFVMLCGFCGQAYGDMIQIDLPYDSNPQSLLESTWQLAPVNALDITNTQDVQCDALTRCVHLGRILGLSDDLTERSLDSVVANLWNWRAIARSEGLSDEDTEQYKPRILSVSESDNKPDPSAAQRRNYRAIEA